MNKAKKETPLDLVGIEVRSSATETKHIGKVGVAPLKAHPSIAGRRILYKEVTIDSIYCRKTASYSIDRMGFDYARETYGFDLFVAYVIDPEAKSLIWTTADIIERSPVVDLGERPQYRFKPHLCEVIPGEQFRVNMGWTNRSVVVDDVLELLGGSNPMSHLEDTGPTGLFG